MKTERKIREKKKLLFDLIHEDIDGIKIDIQKMIKSLDNLDRLSNLIENKIPDK